MKLDIFKSEDFDRIWDGKIIPDHLQDVAAFFAKTKLNRWLKENGKIVYTGITASGVPHLWLEEKRDSSLSKAFLICIEPIETCNHPKEKVKTMVKEEIYGDDINGHTIANASFYGYQCDCGAKVAPKEFEEVK